MRSGLLEREAAVRRLEELALGVARGDGGVLVIESQAGSGKTALLGAAAEIAALKGLRVLRARGFELERQFGFGVARQLFERSLVDATPEHRLELLDGAARNAARALSVELEEGIPSSSTEAVIHGLYWLALNLTQREPVLLIVDDVQWTDESSWQWLGYLARRIDGGRLGLVVAGRSGTTGAQERRCSEIARMRGEDPLVLGPLSLPGVHRMIQLYLGEDAEAEFGRACYELTQGNPFLVIELLRAVAAHVLPPVAASVNELQGLTPDRVAWSVRARLGRLGELPKLIAETLAVLGQGSLHQIAALSETTAVATAEGIDSLVASELVGRDQPFTFVHPLVGQVIYDGIPPGRTIVLHRTAAGMLAQRGSSSDRVASHLLKVPVGADEWAAGRLLEAARRAGDQRAFATAAVYLAHALNEQTPAALRAEIVGDLGLAEERLRKPEGIPRLYEAIELSDDTARTVTLVRALGRALILEGRVAEGVDVLERGIERMNGDRPKLAWELELELQAFARTVPETVERANRRVVRLIDEAKRDPEGRRWLDQFLVQRPCWEATDWRDSQRRATARLARRPSPFHTDPDALGNYTAVQALGWCDMYGDALENLELAFEAAARHGSITAHVLASTYRAEVHLRRGAFAKAEADALAAVELIDEHRLQIPAALAFAWLVKAMIERGKASEGWAVVRERGFDQAVPDRHVFAMLYEARARLHAVDHRTDRALSDALEAGRLLAALGPGPTPLPWRATAALAAHRMGRVDQARDLAAQDLDLARRFGAPRALGISLRTAALVGPADPIPGLRESVEVLERSQVRGELARSLVELGSAMRRRRQAVSEARSILREALDLAHRCDAVVVEQRARDELVAAGGRPRRPLVRGLESLTARELRVAQLAAAGSTNREVAQVLFISPRTVEHHLRNIYLKLGISSRAELQALIERVDGLPGDGQRASAGVSRPDSRS